MTDEQKIERMYDLAAQVVAKCEIKGTQFSEHPYWPQDQVVALTEGQLRGRVFGAWMPVAGAAYRDEAVRQALVRRSEDVWRGLAMSELVPMTLLKGPKAKLPA